MHDANGVRTFCSSRLAGCIALACSTLFLGVGLVGLVCVWASGDQPAGAAFFAVFGTLGLVVSALTIVTLRMSVTVGPDGVTKSSSLGGFTASWAEIESWRVIPSTYDNMDHEVRFRVRGRSSEVVVHEAEVYRPGFEAFQDAIRAFAAEREIVAPS
jgi:hypothetical protein